MSLKIISEHRKLGRQIFNLALSDLRRTYRGAALGWTWSLIKPATMIGVYWFVLGKGLRAGQDIDGASYFVWLLAGIVPWFYMRDMFSSGTNAFKKYRYLITKIKFPVSTIPTFIGMSNLAVHLGILIIAIPILALTNGAFSWTIIQLPLYMLLMFALMITWSLMVAPLAAVSKDFANLVKSLVQILFWVSGILFSIQSLESPLLKSILLLNPVTYIIQGYRNSLISNTWFYEDTKSLLLFMCTLILMALLASYILSRARNEMADAL